MSKLYVNELVPRDASVITAPNLQLPAGSVVQYKSTYINTQTTINTGTAVDVVSLNFTPKYSNSIIVVQNCHGQTTRTTGVGTGGWLNNYIRVDGSNIEGQGAIGYPHDFNDERLTFTLLVELPSWGTTTKNVSVACSVGGTVTYYISHQGFRTSLFVWEIAQ